MPNVVKIRYSNTPGAVPGIGSLSLGQVAINVVDRILFWFDGTTIQSFTLQSGATGIAVTVPSGHYYNTTINDVNVKVTSKIILSWGNFTDIDENGPDPTIMINAIAANGSFVLSMEATNNNKFSGIFKFNYIII